MPTLLGIPLNSMTAIIAKTVDIYFENLKLKTYIEKKY